MTELSFANYRVLPITPVNGTVFKWKAVDLTVKWPPLNLDRTSIGEMNQEVNRKIRYKSDPVGKDIWQSPEETLRLEVGDCEDFAVLKYGILTAAGMPDDCVRIIVGEIKNILVNRPHAWCAVLLEGEWYALDNLFDKLALAEPYINWLPQFSLSRHSAIEYGPIFRMVDVLPPKGSVT